MRRLVVGDIHGAYKALAQVLERASFEPKSDLLISLGDVVDGWPEAKDCVELLVGLPHLAFVIGNHDQWFLDWLNTQVAPPIWTSQGGWATLESYRDGVPLAHKAFFRDAPFFHIEDEDQVFVHGGLDPRISDMRLQNREAVIWDRSLFNAALRWAQVNPEYTFGKWRRIYIGHTTVTNIGASLPVQMANVIAMDTGAGWEGCLSLMDIDSSEVWQSDKTSQLYPGHAGRR